MTKIKTITPKTYKGEVTGHAIILDNGVAGYLDDKNSDKNLAVGETITYTLEVRQNKRGGDYNLLSIKRVGGVPADTPRPSPPSTPLPKQPVSATLPWDVKAKIASDAMRFMIDLLIADKVEDGEPFKVKYREVVQAMLDAVNECEEG